MNINKPNTKIVVFEYEGSGQEKIKGIKQFGHHIDIVEIINIQGPLASFIDEPELFINDKFNGDLVLCFFKHPDLVHYLAKLCQEKGIPLIASGSKCDNALSPFTCCGLGRHKNLGHYGDQFGLPEFSVTTKNSKITAVEVTRGASCGATWVAAQKIIGLTTEEALSTYPREVQYLCVADPSAFDPISGKSSLHYAGDVHIARLRTAIKNEK
jgi:hypothetical protein